MSLNSQTVRSLKIFCSGAIAGIISRSATNPMERVKVLRQTTHPEYQGKGMLESMVFMIKYEGFAALFKGNLVNCIKTGPQSAIEFGTFDLYRKLFFKNQKLTSLKAFTCGCMTGMTLCIATYPLDLLRTILTMQVNSDEYKGICSSFMQIYRNSGFFGLYKGLGMAILGITPYISLKMATYNVIKNMFYNENQKASAIASLTMGAFSGFLSGTVTYPTELIRRRIQGSLLKSGKKYNGIVDCIQKTYQNEGMRGFFQGLVACNWKVVPSTAITFAIDNYLKQKMNVFQKQF